MRADQPGPSGDGGPGETPPTPRAAPGYAGELIFGSAHSAGFNMAFCDGSVRLIQFDIDPEVHRTYGHRYDGVIVSEE